MSFPQIVSFVQGHGKPCPYEIEMTPTDQFAQKRAAAIELIQQHAPQRLQQSLIDLLRPAVALNANRTDDSQIPVGASKFGGAPDVPADFEWPQWNEKPLGFLAQINLEEVAPFDVEGLLPKSGILSFFYEVDDPEWTDVSSEGSWQVSFFYVDDLTRASIRRATEIEVAIPVLHPKMMLNPSWQAPAEDKEILRDIEFKLSGNNPLHQLLGYATPIIWDPTYSAASRQELEHNPQDWVLLLQFDSDEVLNTMWGDVGTLYFLIRRDDLEKRNFEKVWMELQFT